IFSTRQFCVAHDATSHEFRHGEFCQNSATRADCRSVGCDVRRRQMPRHRIFSQKESSVAINVSVLVAYSLALAFALATGAFVGLLLWRERTRLSSVVLGAGGTVLAVMTVSMTFLDHLIR